MRKVFSSPRLENVEAVAKMLEDAGIEVRLTHGRSYKGAIRGNFTYREDEARAPLPAVWIVNSEDQPGARVLLREAGLLDSTRSQSESFLAPTVHAAADANETKTARRRAFRIKLGLLLVIAAVIALGFVALRKSPPPAPAAQPAAQPAAAPAAPAAAPATASTTFVVAMPLALAAMLIQAELEAQTPALACLAVEGKDPPAPLLAELQRPGAKLQSASDCRPGDAATAKALQMDVAEYRTDGSGVGTVRLQIADTGPDGSPRSETRLLEVEREGDRWHVLRVLETR